MTAGDFHCYALLQRITLAGNSLPTTTSVSCTAVALDSNPSAASAAAFALVELSAYMSWGEREALGDNQPKSVDTKTLQFILQNSI